MNNARTTVHIRPSDASDWVSCRRRAWLNLHGEFEGTDAQDPFDVLIAEQGLAHEADVLAELSESHEVHTADSEEDTIRLMSRRAPVIYQAQLVDESLGISGYPDFLILNESGQYQAADAKLTTRADKKSLRIQLGVYRKLLGNNLPAIVFLGNGEQALIDDDASPLANEFLADMRSLRASREQPKAHYSHSKCGACPYLEHCEPAFVKDEALTLLSGVDSRAATALATAGITNISELANCDPSQVPDMPHFKGKEKKHRAVLQAKAWFSDEAVQIKPLNLPGGQWIHFDIEDNPLTDDVERHVYLWGFLVPDTAAASGNNRESREIYETVWTDDENQDESGWIGFLEKIDSYRMRFPELVLAHYSPHEMTTIRQYATRYDMLDHPTVLYLLGSNSPMFDLHRVVTSSLVLPVQSYGLKAICKHPGLVNFQWSDDGSGSQWSIVQFQQFLQETSESARAELKARICAYNRDDVLATRRLEQWLRRHFPG